MAAIDKAYNIDDLALIAKRRLPKGLYEFIDRGAEDEVTMRENVASIKRVLIRQRVGIDTSKRDFGTSLFGVEQTMPIGLAVTGLVGMLAYKGEQSMARRPGSAALSIGAWLSLVPHERVGRRRTRQGGAARSGRRAATARLPARSCRAVERRAACRRCRIRPGG